MDSFHAVKTAVKLLTGNSTKNKEKKVESNTLVIIAPGTALKIKKTIFDSVLFEDLC